MPKPKATAAKCTDGAIDAPTRLVIVATLAGMIVGALLAPDHSSDDAPVIASANE